MLVDFTGSYSSIGEAIEAVASARGNHLPPLEADQLAETLRGMLWPAGVLVKVEGDTFDPSRPEKGTWIQRHVIPLLR